jgi:predicted CXXCH cytochrome family protein
MKHKFQQVDLPGCATCHGHHNIQSPSDEQLGMTSEAVCTQCHNQGRLGATFLGARIAEDMRQGMDDLKSKIALAEQKLDHAERLGMEVRDARFRLREANDALKMARTVVHSFALEPLQQTLAVGMEISDASAQAADAAVEEYRYRRIWLGLSLIPILIVVGVLLLYIRALPVDRAPGESDEVPAPTGP